MFFSADDGESGRGLERRDRPANVEGFAARKSGQTYFAITMSAESSG